MLNDEQKATLVVLTHEEKLEAKYGERVGEAILGAAIAECSKRIAFDNARLRLMQGEKS